MGVVYSSRWGAQGGAFSLNFGLIDLWIWESYRCFSSPVFLTVIFFVGSIGGAEDLFQTEVLPVGI